MPFPRYLLSRMLSYALVTLVCVFLNFWIPRLMPGNPIAVILGRMSAAGMNMPEATAVIEEYKRMFGLDKDLTTQFLSYLRELLRGNLGYSIAAFPAKVSDLILVALPWTIGLLSVVTLISWSLGTLLGAVSGWMGERSRFIGAFNSLALCLYAIPYWLMAIILIFTLACLIPLFPLSGGYTTGATIGLSLDFLMDVIWHSMLPALSIIITSLGWWYLSMRSMIIGLKGEDFIILAEAKGLSQTRILWKYALRNALIPQITGLALSLGNMMGGALITESLFAYPGIGWLLYFAITNIDYNLIQGITLLVTLSVCTATLTLDLMYSLIDPRIKHRGE